MTPARKVAARYIKSKVAPLYIDQERLKRWFEHILKDTVTNIVISGKGDKIFANVNSVKRVHSLFEIQFEVTADVTRVRITPKIIAVPLR